MSREANERRMRALVARWRKEGGSAASFAARHRLSTGKFGYWRRRQQRASSSKRKVEPGDRIEFRPIHLVGPAVPTRAVLEIALPGGERVLVHEGAATELVAAAVTAVRAPGSQC